MMKTENGPTYWGLGQAVGFALHVLSIDMFILYSINSNHILVVGDGSVKAGGWPEVLIKRKLSASKREDRCT